MSTPPLMLDGFRARKASKNDPVAALPLTQQFPGIEHRRIAIDVDGVLLNFDQGFQQLAQKILQRPIQQVSNAYAMQPRLGLTKEESDAVWNAMHTTEDGWPNLPVYPGAAEAFRRLQTLGYELVAVTAIDPQHVEKRWNNLQKHGIVPNDIVGVGAGKNASKGETLARLRPIKFIEDQLKFLAEAPFVPYRVWIDHGDEQFAPLEESIIQTSSLQNWVTYYEQHLLERVVPDSKKLKA